MAGVDTTTRRFLKTEFLEMYNARNVSTKSTNTVVIPEWCNKPKGILQILYERGFIGPAEVKTPSKMQYSKDGKQNHFHTNTGKLKADYEKHLLTRLLSNFFDFIEQKTDIE